VQEELFRGLNPINDQAQTPKADRIAVLAIAYHNIGVEQEFLKKVCPRPSQASLMSVESNITSASKTCGSSRKA
jgi:hypothetical protein